MKKMIAKLNRLFWVIFLLSCSLAAEADCKNQLISAGFVQVQQGSFGDNTCFVAIHSMRSTEMVYRDYIVTDKGLLMVFNSYGDGPNSTMTGAREFYFFPRNKTVSFSVDPRSNDVTVHAANGDDFVFGAGTAQLKLMIHGDVTLDQDVTPENKGGLEITNYDGMYLDVGFSLGHAPNSEPERRIEFHSIKGTTCELKVKDVFVNVNSQPTITMSDDELSAFLQKKCSHWN